MPIVTKRLPSTTNYGVCYDISRSPYTSSASGYEFRFTTRENKRDFDYGLVGHMKWLEDSMGRRFKFAFDLYEFALFDWYRRCESRGFSVLYIADMFEFTSPDQVIVRGAVDHAQKEGC